MGEILGFFVEDITGSRALHFSGKLCNLCIHSKSE